MAGEQTKEEKDSRKTVERIVYVGRKSLNAHLKVSRAFLEETGKICIIARGRLISKAVYLAEILKRDGVKIQKIATATEAVKSFNGGKHFTSVIKITLATK